MKKKKLTARTCCLMGVAGCFVQLMAGVLIALALGDASFLLMAGFALLGAMLLFLGLAENDRNKRLRVRLLWLFLLHVAGWLVPVPVGTLMAAAVIPLLLVLYGRSGDGPWLAGLIVAELGYVVAYTLAVTGFTGSVPARLVLGLAMTALALCRGGVLLRLARYLAPKESSPLGPQQE